ncbi:DNA repair protein RAD16, partial [Coemansia sp. RSA 1722]
KYLDTLLLSSKATQGAVSSVPAASWLASDSANILFAVSRSRVFRRLANAQVPPQTREKLRELGLPENIAPVLEVPPKLQLLAQILDEVGAANRAAGGRGEEAGPVLVMAGSSRECRLIRSYLESLHETVDFDIPESADGDSEHPRMMVNLLQGFFRWKAHANSGKLSAQADTFTKAKATASAAATGAQSYNRGGSHGNRGSRGGGQAHRAPPPSKRRRVRGASTAGSGVLRAPAEELEQESAELAVSVGAESHAASRDRLLGFGMHESQAEQDCTAAALDTDSADLYLDEEDADWADALDTFDECFGILPKGETIAVHSYS